MSNESITLKSLLEAGIHFGHRPRFWNPKMAPYIFGARNDLHIIDLQQTLTALNRALKVVENITAQGGRVIFVGTKYAAQDLVAEFAAACDMPYVNRRWLGGMLTNYKTIRQSVKRLKDLEFQMENAELGQATKKERLKSKRELEKLNASLGGIKDMGTLPDLLFVIDVQQEKIAIAEAKKLGIPVIGVVDTNSDPDGIDYVIPGNDDSMKAIRFFMQVFSETITRARANIIEKAQSAKATIINKSVVQNTEDDKKPTANTAAAEASAKPAKRSAAKPAAEATKSVAQKKPVAKKTTEKKSSSAGVKPKSEEKTATATKPKTVKKAATTKKVDDAPAAKTTKVTKKTPAKKTPAKAKPAAD